MMCPNCSHQWSNICHSYHVKHGIKRERSCKRCLFHFITLESTIQQGQPAPSILDELRKITNAQDLEEAVSIAYAALDYPFSNHIKK